MKRNGLFFDIMYNKPFAHTQRTRTAVMHLKKEKTEFLAPVFGRQSAARRPAPALPAPQQPPADVPGFDYTAAVAEIYAHFPEAQETLRFYDLSNGRFVDPDPAEVAKMEAYMADAENARDVARFTSYAQLYAKEGNSAVMHGLDRGRCVMLSVGGNKVDLLDPGCTAAQNIYFILDHETGHAVARFGARGQFS